MTEMSAVEVTMHIPAAPEDVFPYFTDPARYVQWMGSEAKLEPVPGGVYRIHMPDGFEAAGEFLQVTQPHRVVFTWGPNPDLREGHLVAWKTYLPRLAVRAAGGDPGADPHS